MSETSSAIDLVYFSSVSENTHRFVEKLDLPAIRIPLRERIEVDDPYVLVLPTYGGGHANGPDPDAGGYVPKQVIAFLEQRTQPVAAPRRHRRGQHQLRRRIRLRG